MRRRFAGQPDGRNRTQVCRGAHAHKSESHGRFVRASVRIFLESDEAGRCRRRVGTARRVALWFTDLPKTHALAIPTARQRLWEPLHVLEGSPNDVRCALSGRRIRLPQEVDIGPSAEVTLGARLMQLSTHEKNRCVLRSIGRVARRSAFVRRAGPSGTIAGTVSGTRVPATRSLAYT